MIRGCLACDVANRALVVALEPAAQRVRQHLIDNAFRKHVAARGKHLRSPSGP